MQLHRIVISLLGAGFSGLLAQSSLAAEPSAAQPTDEQLHAAKTAFARFGARHSLRTDWTTRKTFDAFDMPPSAKDDDLKQLPNLPFPFALAFDESKISGRGLEHLNRLDHLVQLELRYTHITDTDLKGLRTLKQLTGLDLKNTAVTNAGLRELAGLKQLRFLNLCGTAVTTAGLKELKVLTHLNYLCLTYEVTDADLRALREIGLLHALSQADGDEGRRPTSARDVTRLDLRVSHVTDDGLGELKCFERLSYLNLGGTRVTGAGLTGLREFKQLTELGLSGTNVGDSGLHWLVELKQLEELDLSGTEITDGGLKDLKRLTQLKKLRIGYPRPPKAAGNPFHNLGSPFRLGTHMTTEGLKDLKKSLPNCEIFP